MMEVWVFISQIDGTLAFRDETWRARMVQSWFPGSYYAFDPQVGPSWLCVGKFALQPVQ